MASFTQKLFPARCFCVMGGLFGAAAIAAFAADTHIGGYFGKFAPLLLGNGAAFLAIGLSGTQLFLPRLAGFIIFIGNILFAATLLSLQYCGKTPFLMAAPIGGGMMIFGWLLFIPSAFCLTKCGNDSAENNRPTLH